MKMFLWDKYMIGKEEYVLVGIDGNYWVFAPANPKSIQEARVLSLEESCFKEFEVKKI